MASALAVMHRMDLGYAPGIGSVAIDTAVGFGTSYLLGRAYHEGFMGGKKLPKILAAVGKLGAVGLQVAMGGGAHWASGVVDAVGQAGLNAYGVELGLEHARKKTGKRPVLISANAPLPAGAQEVDAIGAGGTRAMSFEQIEEAAGMR